MARTARARSADRQPPSLHRTLSTPGLYLWRMFVFLVLVGLLVAVLYQQLWDAMLNNLGLKNASDIRTVTLSYTFFEAKTERAKTLLGSVPADATGKGG